MDKMQIYNKLPIFAQNLACYYEGNRILRTRLGEAFQTQLDEYCSHDNWSYDQMCSLRDEKLRKMISHCYSTVPYYRRCFDDRGIDPKSIKTIDDLNVLPIITKDEVKKHISDFLSSAVDTSLTKIHPTGGTTGAGLRFVTTNTEEAEQWAVWWRYRIRNGIDYGAKCGVFGGKVVVPLKQKKAPFWRMNAPCNQVYFSSYHITNETVRDYVNCIRSQNINWIHGYPSVIADLAQKMVDVGLTLSIGHVSIGAENLYKWQSDVIEKAFGVKPIQHYGLTEGVANISENPDRTLSVDEDFCCVEFVEFPGEGTKIIGTTLSNYAMPLLRYDTGDLATVPDKAIHNDHGRIICGLNGRSNEFVLLPNGTKVGAAAISLIINDFPEIMSSQIIQNSIEKIEVDIIIKQRSNLDDKKLMYKLRERFGNAIDIQIRYVDNLKKTKSGKQKLVISEI